METLVPVFPQSEFEKRLINSHIGCEPFLSHLARRLSGLENVTIISNVQEILEVARGAGYEAIEMPLEWVDGETLLSSGSGASIEYLLNSGGIKKESAVMVLNWLAPLVKKGSLCRAREMYLEKGGVILSVTPAPTSPLRLNAPFTTVAVDTVAVIDPDESGSRLLVCKALPFPWKFFGITEDEAPGSVFIKDPYRHYRDKLEKVDGRGLLQLAFRFEDINVARRVQTVPEIVFSRKRELCGLSYTCEIIHSPVVTFRNPDRTLSFFIRKDVLQNTDSTGVLRVWPLESGEVVDGKGLVFDLTSGPEQLDTIEINGIFFCGPFGCEDEKYFRFNAYQVFVLKRSLHHYTDILSPMETDSGLWEIAAENGIRRNLLTGQPILGRQQFPEVLEPIPVLAVGQAGILQSEAWDFSCNKVYGIRLSRGECVVLKDDLGFAEYCVWRGNADQDR